MRPPLYREWDLNLPAVGRPTRALLPNGFIGGFRSTQPIQILFAATTLIIFFQPTSLCSIDTNLRKQQLVRRVRLRRAIITFVVLFQPASNIIRQANVDIVATQT